MTSKKDKTSKQENDRLIAQYNADVTAMTAAAFSWKQAHPQAELRFVPMRRPDLPAGKGVIIAPLNASMIRKLAGNASTADLLATLEKACEHGGGASVLMAGAVVESVFGIASFAHASRGNTLS